MQSVSFNSTSKSSTGFPEARWARLEEFAKDDQDQKIWGELAAQSANPVNYHYPLITYPLTAPLGIGMGVLGAAWNGVQKAVQDPFLPDEYTDAIEAAPLATGKLDLMALSPETQKPRR